MYSKFKGVSCPSCNVEFVEKDDIVVCPKCGTPYHRTCIKCVEDCVNFQKHAEGFTFECPKPIKPEPEDTQIQPSQSRAQEQAGSQSQFERIMSALNQNIKNDDVINDVPAGEIAEFVGQNSFYFIPKFKLNENGKRPTLNFSAFIFESFYYLYRKMYKEAIIIFLVSTLLFAASMVMIYPGVANTFSDASYVGIGFLINFLTFALRFVVGFFANSIYQKKVIKSIKAIKVAEQPKEKQRLLAEKRGGVSTIAVGIVFIAIFVFAFAIRAGTLLNPQFNELILELGKLLLPT